MREAQVSEHINRQQASGSPHTDPNLRLAISPTALSPLNSTTTMAQTLALSLLILVLALYVPWTQGTKEGEALAGRRELKRHLSCL